MHHALKYETYVISLWIILRILNILYILINLQVTFQGQVIGAIVADDQIIAQRAAKLVEVKYEELSPIIITIEVRLFHYILNFKNYLMAIFLFLYHTQQFKCLLVSLKI